jgi:hypothetical protein
MEAEQQILVEFEAVINHTVSAQLMTLGRKIEKISGIYSALHEMDWPSLEEEADRVKALARESALKLQRLEGSSGRKSEDGKMIVISTDSRVEHAMSKLGVRY